MGSLNTFLDSSWRKNNKGIYNLFGFAMTLETCLLSSHIGSLGIVELAVEVELDPNSIFLILYQSQVHPSSSFN